MFETKTEPHLRQFRTSQEDIYPTTKNCKSSKTHRWENISIKMIKISGQAIPFLVKLLERNFHRLKKSTAVPIQKK